eukprot:scaffold132634_cov53-Attheya_sp.AAC.3
MAIILTFYMHRATTTANSTTHEPQTATATATSLSNNNKRSTPNNEGTHKRTIPVCPDAVEQLLSETKKKIVVNLMAMPHTVSSDTQMLFHSIKDVAWNASVPHEHRGFTCPTNSNQRVQALTCTRRIDPLYNASIDGSVSHGMDGLASMFGKLEYMKKRHAPFVKMNPISDVLFTTLRQSHQFVLSQWRDRTSFDTQWAKEYPDQSNVKMIQPEEWVQKAWWRHNLFTKMLSTDDIATRLIWTFPNNPGKFIVPSKQESDAEAALADQSMWLQTAIRRLKGLPFFGVMHRMTESFEIFAFHLCIPVVKIGHAFHKPPIVSPELQGIVNRTFVLDILLLQEAEVLFDALVADMREKKARGVLCDMSTALKLPPDMEFGLQCVDEITK